MSDAITTTGTTFLALAPESDVADVIRENLGSGSIEISDLDRASIPTGGITQFVIPGDDGEEATVPEIEGVVLAQKRVRVYYSRPYGEGNQDPPDCASKDAELGHGNPGGRCDTCALNEWDTGKGGKGKACKERHLMLLLQPDAQLPIVVSAPPSSLKSIRRYMMRLTKRGKRFYDVVTSLKLAKAQNDGGIAYGQITAHAKRDLTGEERSALAELVPAMLKLFSDVTVTDRAEVEDGPPSAVATTQVPTVDEPELADAA
jgi:hypothetical protein